MHYIYILKMSNNKYYTGITNNINRRLREHLKGRSKSTRNFRPLQLVCLLTHFSRKEARILEVKIKNRGARKFLIMNKFEKVYSDVAKYPDMLRFLIDLNYKPVTINNEDLIIFL